MDEKACEACEAYKALVFTSAAKGGIDTDIAREIANVASTAWQAGYYYLKNKKV